MMPIRQVVKGGFYAAQRSIARLYSWLLPRSTQRFAVFSLHAIAVARSDMAVSPSRFRRQLAALLEVGYGCLDFDEVLRAVKDRAFLQRPAFALTFDDGYRSVYEEAWPVLEELGVPATIFVTVNFVDGKIAPPWHSTDAALVREYTENAAHFRPLEWPQLREMARSKRIRIGSHSLSHFLMGRLDGDTLREEAERSKHILEDRLGVPVSVFSYPFGVARYGAYSPASEEAVRHAGFVSSCTSEIGRIRAGSGNPYLLPRISLVDDDTGLDACAKAAGAYDWVGLAQSAFQKIFPNPHGV
jgi:peptidoglycan/xylan/chitin deacetylase (PgdA/CDA1 family)